MRTYAVELYEYFHVKKVEGQMGRLTCLLPHIPEGLRTGRRRPAVLVLPGGGYSYTSEREAEPVALSFLTKGYAAFILEYSCAPSTFPIALQEATMAMAYIRENAQELQVDPAMVAAIGFSAGGHLCGCLGTMYDCPEVQSLGLRQKLRPDALGLSYPVAVSWGKTHQGSFRNVALGDEALKDRLSLDKRVRPDMPPVFLWHTRNDEVVPVRNSLVLASALEEAGVDFAMHIYRNGPHGLSSGNSTVYKVDRLPASSPDVTGWIDEMLRFFGELGFGVTDQK